MMKLIERVLLLAIILVVAALVINGLIERPQTMPVTEHEAPSADEKPLADYYKTPADDLSDPLAEVVFIAEDTLSMEKSLSDFQRLLPKDKYDEIIAVFKSKHTIGSSQSDSGEIQLRYPSQMVLKSYHGKSAREILDSASK